MNHCVARPALFYVACLFTFASNAHTAEFFGLGLPASGASAVSSDGTTIVGGGPGPQDAFRWTRESGTELLLGLRSASDISIDGSTIVGNGWDGPSYWTAETGTVAIGVPPARLAGALGTNDDGSIIVGYHISSPEEPYYERAFQWTRETGLEFLTPAILDARGFAYDVSANGVVVGLVQVRPADTQQAFRWTRDSGITILGGLPNATTSGATSVSEDGSVIVGESGGEAFRWTADEGMTGLGKLAGHEYSRAEFVSNDGSLVIGLGSGQAFVWDEAHGMRDLQQVLSSEHGLADQLSGWQLYSAAGISADARTIVGTGFNPARIREAWVAYLDAPLGGPQSLLTGDFNNNGLVEQADLDLVLGSWGAAASNVPPTWTNDLPSGIIDQAELDRVLAHWGNTSPGAGSATAIPEPGSVFLLLSCLIVSAVLRRGDRR